MQGLRFRVRETLRDKEDLLGREGGFEEERHARVGLAEGDEQRAAARHGLDVLDERELRAHLREMGGTLLALGQTRGAQADTASGGQVSVQGSRRVRCKDHRNWSKA